MIEIKIILLSLLCFCTSLSGQVVLPDDEIERFSDTCTNDVQYQALKDIYYALDGKNWILNQSWGMDCNYCQWPGIDCNEAGKITHLALPANNMKGLIPSSISGLNSLRIIVLDQNEIVGPLPEAIYSMSELRFIILNNNRINDTISNEIENLKNLRWLLLHDNEFSGNIPPELGSLGNLLIVNLGNNFLEGEIPDELSSLSNSNYIDLSGNDLSGCIPESFRSFCGKNVVLSRNPCLSHQANFSNFCLSDTCTFIPDQNCISCDDGIQNQGEDDIDCGGPCTACPPCDGNMEYEALMSIYNNMNGENWDIKIGWAEGCEICEWYGVECDSMKRVTGLYLPFNKLKNEIPEKIGNLTHLNTLILDQNSIVGMLPQSIYSLSNLSYLILSNNNISDTLSNKIDQLSGLKWLLLNNNNIYGRIPKNVGNLLNINQLLLNSNNLDGVIPPSLGNLSKVRNLHLNDNNLSGCIPDTLSAFCGRDIDLSENICLSHGGSFRRFCARESCTINMIIGCGTCDDGIQNQDEKGIDCGGEACEPCISCFEMTDYTPLMAFYDATNGQEWMNNEGWGENCNYCQWYGVQCDSMKKVKNLLLPLNGLKGELPTDITELDHLEGLILDLNELKGSLPFDIGNLSKLKFFSVSSNRIEGSIPSSIGNLKEMSWLLLNNNMISGVIPPSLANLITIDQLLLSGNKLIGSIPDSLAFLPNIKNMHLNDNQLSGCIPESFRQLCGTDVNLRDNICLSHNADFIDFCRSITTCELPKIVGCGTCNDGIQNQDEEGVDCGGSCENECSLCPETPDYEPLIALYEATDGANWTNNSGWADTCDICQWYGVVCNDEGRVKNLFLPMNGLKNNLPSTIGALIFLEALIIDQNELSGPFPKEIGQLTNLQFLLANDNDFTGAIPTELGNLGKLKWLLLNNNNLTDQIPTSLENLVSIDQFILSGNKLMGMIPEELGNLVTVNNFHLNDNLLEGCIPSSFDAFCGKDVKLFNNECLSHNGVFAIFCAGDSCKAASSDLCGTCDDGVQNNGEKGIDCGGPCMFCDDCPESPDYLALMNFYNATIGDDWLINTGWGDTCDVCSWYGVECNDSNRVNSIFLPFNGLKGELPSEIGDLEFLQSLFLDFNDISGHIPDDISRLSHLELLILTSNHFTGSIPESIGSLSNLKWLLLNKNELTGEIPSVLGFLSNMNRLILNENHLIGSIPASLSNLGKIEFMMLQTNELSGCIPAGLSVFCEKNVRLDGNECLSHGADFIAFCDDPVCDEVAICECIAPNKERTILKEMFDSLGGENWLNSSGWKLDCDHCNWFGVTCNEARKVEKIDLHLNELSGSIPASMGNLSELTFLDLAKNQIQGALPSELAAMSKLTFLRLAENKITGKIPATFGKMTRLWDLRLNNNKLTGSIPSQLGRLDNLFNLYLSYNELEGKIPPEIGALGNIFQLSLQNNMLSGCIPESFINLCSSKIDLSENPCLSHDADITRFCSDEECDLTDMKDCDIDIILPGNAVEDIEAEVSARSADLSLEIDIKEGDLKIYPNPTSYNLIVEYLGIKEGAMLQIFDVSGRKVFSEITEEDYMEVNVSNLKSGLYILQLVNNKGVISKTFFKK
ncbi:MAG: T9SS type A sorting domain-containing protein [Saprospiraceae bacterium]